MHLVTVVIAAVAAQPPPNYASAVFWIALVFGGAKVASMVNGKKRP